ncbi:MAG TPA: isocitrate lyase/phosphoenolpyruvate mutase family protein, partial [Candidatus Acidoferrales bacterium]|nr:isocitrate lyase/phosphoenolpyruvate mutase family protein [Candidatus Acidoferrales bacterium]
MNKQRQREQAERFRALHRPGKPLVLANAWDAASARLFAQAGHPAIGTTSAGVAWTLGFPDGERISVGNLCDSVARMIAVLDASDTPLTVDVESGFGSTTAEVCDVVRQLIKLGAVGINIEDGTDPEVLCGKITAVRKLAASADVPLFINARTNVYLRGYVAPPEQLDESVRRLKRYVEVGADGVFVPGIVKLGEIERLAAQVKVPVNVYAFRGVPSVPELAEAG